ncbi:MAG: DEAD/DEAH box helicase [Rhodanobacteraceae bacterium]|nr:DEAD/DEAH box helicase [Rhodanobacteraceae bacterium]
MPLAAFHPAVTRWFAAAFEAPTPAQAAAWAAIAQGRHTLVAAPTGSGKTLAAFLHALDALVREALAGTLGNATRVVYVSPLKALSNDVHLNLERPLAGISAELEALGLPPIEIRSAVRTGDTPQAERAKWRKRPPHIVVTTPESLYILLGSDSGRAMLAGVGSVIVDEIHALAGNKRGAHLALTLERLDALCGRRLTRIGLSATQRPLAEAARFLVGNAAIAADGTPDCAIVDVGQARTRDLALELPSAPLAPVMSNQVWSEVYAQLADLVRAHRSTLVFVNTRRMAERAARHLSEHLGHERVAAHHGSLARERRLDAEQRLKRGELAVLVATSSLELGIDIGDVDLVCQLGSPRAIAAFLQRVGRSGHSLRGLPKGRLFPTSRDDLVECVALLAAVGRGELETLIVPPAPADVLAQQIVAEVSCGECSEADLYQRLRGAWPYAQLSREDYTALVRMLAEGYTTRRGPRAAYLHRDAVNGMLRARRGARMTALTSGGAIPDTADYPVVLEPEGIVVGSVHEDFAIESLAGDVFQLGNQSYRIRQVDRGRLRVEDAQGLPPTIPFWVAEAPGRSDALSAAVSRLRAQAAALLPPEHDSQPPTQTLYDWLADRPGIGAAAARQLADYLATAKAALGVLPTQADLVMERFFDESGGTQLIIHSPFGTRLNRAWGLALRKRFCRRFNFELQAAATDDAIILSLSTSHSFPLADVARYLHSNSVGEVLVQALLDAPMFGVRWRWNATTALALPRFVGGTKVAAPLQRMRAEDLLATVFPDQVACLENIVGEREVPDHPLVAQTMRDCLDEAMDLDGLTALLKRVEAGEVRIHARDLASPSPLAMEILSARPYAFLDDAPLEERRTQAVQARRWVDPESAEDFGRLDPAAIEQVRSDAWPQARDADELHEALVGVGFLTPDEIAREAGWPRLLDQLVAARRATRLDAPAVWVAAERLPQWRALAPEAALAPAIDAPAEYAAQAWEADAALVDVLRARLSGLGPTTLTALTRSLHALSPAAIESTLIGLEGLGYAMRGQFSGTGELEWCERHLLARIHRLTVQRLRREIEPVEPAALVRFLSHWQGLAGDARKTGPEALAAVLAQLEGWEAPAAAWESEILPARVASYEARWLDELCLAGRLAWARLRPPADPARESSGPVRATPIVLLPRREYPRWAALAAGGEAPALSSRARRVHECLAAQGASFYDELQGATRLLESELNDALGELVAAGLAHADSYAGLRALLAPAQRSPRRARRMAAWAGVDSAGRWSPIRRAPAERDDAMTEHIARVLLKRWGVVCWTLLRREAAWLPPWRELVLVYRRLEARGEIRGGRFVAGLSGEQYALPEAVALLRSLRAPRAALEWTCVCGADPLNLLGHVLPGDKLPALAGTRVLYRDGVPVATLVSGEFHALPALPPAEAWPARQMLLRGARRLDAVIAPAPGPA